jgi:hypothetical protein
MIRRSMIVLAGAAALAVPSVAAAEPSPTRVSLAPHATYVSAQQINVQTSITCTEGMSYFVSASVAQQRGTFTTFGSGFATGQCTGRHQNVAVPVVGWSYPGWQLGEAVASVFGCGFTCDSGARVIRVVL